MIQIYEWPPGVVIHIPLTGSPATSAGLGMFGPTTIAYYPWLKIDE